MSRVPFRWPRRTLLTSVVCILLVSPLALGTSTSSDIEPFGFGGDHQFPADQSIEHHRAIGLDAEKARAVEQRNESDRHQQISERWFGRSRESPVNLIEVSMFSLFPGLAILASILFSIYYGLRLKDALIGATVLVLAAMFMHQSLEVWE